MSVEKLLNEKLTSDSRIGTLDIHVQMHRSHYISSSKLNIWRKQTNPVTKGGAKTLRIGVDFLKFILNRR